MNHQPQFLNQRQNLGVGFRKDEGSSSGIWQDLSGGRATRGTEAGGPQGATATQWWGEAEQAELRREVLASAEEPSTPDAVII